jgi:hypothetical protein
VIRGRRRAVAAEQALVLERAGEQQLRPRGGLLGREQVADPLARDDVDDRVGGEPMRGSYAVDRMCGAWVDHPLGGGSQGGARSGNRRSAACQCAATGATCSAGRRAARRPGRLAPRRCPRRRAPAALAARMNQARAGVATGVLVRVGAAEHVRGARKRPAEQRSSGLPKVLLIPSSKVHLEGDARWTPDNRRSHGGRSGVSVARGQRAVGAAGRHAGADAGAVAAAGRDQAAPSRPGPGSCDSGSGGDAR